MLLHSGSRSRRVVLVLIAASILTGILLCSPTKASALRIEPSSTLEMTLSRSIDSRLVEEESSPTLARAMTEEVWDTYKSFVGILGGQPVQGLIYDVTYKRITFNSYYEQTAPTWMYTIPTDSDGEYIPEYDAVGFGSYDLWKCNYIIH